MNIFMNKSLILSQLPVYSNLTDYLSYEDILNVALLDRQMLRASINYHNMDEEHDILLGNQLKHYNSILRWLKYYRSYVDVSEMGAGKTYVTCAIAKKLKLNVFVLAPKSTLSSWVKVLNIYGIKEYEVNTYQKLRYKNSYVYKDEIDGSIELYEVIKDKISRGMLLIVDESHNIKNDKCMQTKIIKRIADEIYKRDNTRSRVALLSATPFDKECFYKSYIKMLGCYRSRLTLYIPSYDQYTYPGFDEILEKCKSINPDDTNRLNMSIRDTLKSYINPRHQKTMEKRRSWLLGLLFTNIIQKYYVYSMDRPDIEVEKDIKNGYYKIEEEADMNKALLNLQRVCSYSSGTNTVNMTNINWGGLTLSLKKIEMLKTSILVRLCEGHMQRDTNSKVVLYFNYIETAKKCASLLSKYNPFYMDGSVTTKRRDKIIYKFNNDSTSRILIGNIRVGGIGISLHDEEGNAPRYMYIIPNYSIINLHQATGRIHRVGSKSDSTIRFVYAKSAMKETRILNALARKSKVLESILSKNVKQGLLLPKEYESYIE